MIQITWKMSQEREEGSEDIILGFDGEIKTGEREEKGEEGVTGRFR